MKNEKYKHQNVDDYELKTTDHSDIDFRDDNINNNSV